MKRTEPVWSIADRYRRSTWLLLRRGSDAEVVALCEEHQALLAEVDALRRELGLVREALHASRGRLRKIRCARRLGREGRA